MEEILCEAESSVTTREDCEQKDKEENSGHTNDEETSSEESDKSTEGSSSDSGTSDSSGASRTSEEDSDSTERTTGFMGKLSFVLGNLLPGFTPFFLLKFECTMCGKETLYKYVRGCAQPICDALLCNDCAHKLQKKYQGTCPVCGFSFTRDVFTKSTLKLCVECGKHFILDSPQKRCVQCRKGGSRKFDPKKYGGLARKPQQDPHISLSLLGFDFLPSEDSSEDSSDTDFH